MSKYELKLLSVKKSYKLFLFFLLIYFAYIVYGEIFTWEAVLGGIFVYAYMPLFTYAYKMVRMPRIGIRFIALGLFFIKLHISVILSFFVPLFILYNYIKAKQYNKLCEKTQNSLNELFSN